MFFFGFGFGFWTRIAIIYFISRWNRNRETRYKCVLVGMESEDASAGESRGDDGDCIHERTNPPAVFPLFPTVNDRF